MEFRSEISETATRKKEPSSDAILATYQMQNNKQNPIEIDLQQLDQLWITFLDEGILIYSNTIDHSLIIEPNICPYQFWRALFIFKPIQKTQMFYLVHQQTNLYLSAKQTSQTDQNTSIISVCLSGNCTEGSKFQFSFQDAESSKVRTKHVMYQRNLRIKNCYSEKYLQVTKQHRYPHLASFPQTEIVLKLHKKGKADIQDIWITKQPSNYLQNGDLVMLQNIEQNLCLTLQPKNQLFYKTIDLKSVINQKFLQIQNYTLINKPIDQVHPSNIVYSLWRVYQIGCFTQLNHRLIYNKDVVVFRHCFINACLIKNYSNETTFSASIFDLNRSSDQSFLYHNYGFAIQNQTMFCFNKGSVDIKINHQPIYLNDTIELDHKHCLFLKKVDEKNIQFLRLFNSNLVNLAQVLLDFLTCGRSSSNNRKAMLLIQKQQKNTKTPTKRPLQNLTHIYPDSRQIVGQQWDQNLAVDYDKLKELITAHHRVTKIIILNQRKQTIYTNCYVIKMLVCFLQTIGSIMKGMAEIKRRKKPILQPLISSIYEFFINIVSPSNCILNSSLFNSLKKLTVIDSQSTILMIYYLARIWNSGNAIDVFIQLIHQADPQDQELSLTCIIDIVQHCFEWKDQYSYKIKDMLTNLGYSVFVNQDDGICLTSYSYGTIFAFSFQQRDKKAIQYLKTAIFSEVLQNNSSMTNQQILMQLIFHLQNKKQMKLNQQLQNEKSEISRNKSYPNLRCKKQQQNSFQRSNFIQLINFYLLNTYACTLSALKMRKFVILNQNKYDIEGMDNFSRSEDENFALQQSNLTKIQDQSSMFMLKKLKKPSFQVQDELIKKQVKKSKSYIRWDTNIYPFLNYEEPPLPIIQIYKHLQSFIQNLSSWDSIQNQRIKNNLTCSNQKAETSMKETKDKKSNQTTSKICDQPLNDQQEPNNKDISNKIMRQHLYFMLQSFNSTISIIDIILSTGYITLRTLAKVQQFVLDILEFMIIIEKRKLDEGLLFKTNFHKKYPKMAFYLIVYSREKKKNRRVAIKQILVQQKRRELMMSINEIFTIILTLKKRIIAHPAIQFIYRHHLLSFNEFLPQYLAIYASHCEQTRIDEQEQSDLQSYDQKWQNNAEVNVEVVRKLLNFYCGNYYSGGQEIILLNLQNLSQKMPDLNKTFASIYKSKDRKGAHSASSQSIQQDTTNLKVPKLVTNREMFLKYSAIFSNCQEIVYNLDLLTSARQNVEKEQEYRSAEASKTATQIKKLLDIINQKLSSLKCKNEDDASANIFIIRAYNISEKLVESIFNTQYFQEDFITQILKFLCQNPPEFSSFSKMHQSLSYSFPLTKIFVKSLQNHLQIILKQTTISSFVSQSLKQAVTIIGKVIDKCRKQLKPKQFILIMGILCEVFPNRTISQKVYHILLQIHSQQKKNSNFGYSQKKNCRQLIFNAAFKDQSSAPKQAFGELFLGNKLQVICPSTIMDAYKTLQTFKQLVTQAQNQQDKYAEIGIYGKQNGTFTQLISTINKHVSLIFRLCENSDEVYRHFTENIIKYDSLLLIAFDPEIPLKYKIPLPIYFRNDDRIYNDQVAISDYLIWISSVLKDYELYLHQLSEYVNQNNAQYFDFHNHVTSKIIRQREYPKISLLFEHSQQHSSQFATSSRIISTSAKLSQHSYYYWQLLFSQPFLHQEEGILVLLEQIITNMKQAYQMQANTNQKQNINKCVIEIYQYLTSMYKNLTEKKYKVKSTHLKIDFEEEGILSGFIRKIRKNLKLILQKYPSLRQFHLSDEFNSQTIAFNITNTLLKNNLLKKFIKVFYYNDYKNINLPIFHDKKLKSQNSDISDGSELSFKNSRSSKLSQQSNDNFRVAEMAILKMSRKQVSIKQFEVDQQEGCRSNQGLFLKGDRFLTRRSTYSPNTIKLNLNNCHYFEERAYMFYEVSKLLGKVCQLIQNSELKSKLEQQFILFFQYSGTSKILKDEIVGVLKYLRQAYISQNNSKCEQLQQHGFIKTIESLKSSTQINFIQQNPSSLILIIKNLILTEEVYIAGQILQSIFQKFKKAKIEQQSAQIFGASDSNQQKKYILSQIVNILKYISLKTTAQISDYCKYLRLLKYILLIFVSKQKIRDQGTLLLQKNISNLLTQYINKILLMVYRFHQKNPTKKSEVNYQKQQKGKKQTIISQVNKISQLYKLQNLDNFEKRIEGVKRQNTNEGKHKKKYLPQLQIEFYYMIELYAIAEAKMTNLQTQLYRLISSKILNMVYGMTLSKSMKLILRSLVQKCGFSQSIMLQDIISCNKKLQYFIQLKINQMSDPKNLVSSNMTISENLSFISIYYDYIYRLFWDEFHMLNRQNKPRFFVQKLESSEGPKVANQIWEAIATLQQNIVLLLLQQKKNQSKFKSFFSSEKQENTDNQQDFERFRLLHKILTQSINLFNIKQVNDKIRTESVKVNRTDNEFEQHEHIVIWNLQSFVESRTSLFSNSDKQNRVKTYTKLYKSLNHLLLSFQQNKSKLLFSFINQDLACSAVFKKDQNQSKSASNIFEYKKYRRDWYNAVIDMLQVPIASSGKQVEYDYKQKQHKIFYISEYLIEDAKESSSFSLQFLNNQLVSKIFLSLPIILASLCLILILWDQYDYRSQDHISIQSFINKLIQINLVCFILLCINRLFLYWKIARFRSYVKLKISDSSNNFGLQNLPKLEIVRCLLLHYTPILLLMTIMFAISGLLIAGYKKYMPLMFLQIFLIQEAIPMRVAFVLTKIIRAGWVPVLTMFLSLWVIYYQSFLTEYTGQSELDSSVTDIPVTTILKLISGQTYFMFKNWLLAVCYNIFIYGSVTILTSSILGHLRLCLQKKQISLTGESIKKCLICESANPTHINNTHNVIKWIDLEVNLRSRNQSSLSYLQLFLRTKMKNHDLSIFGFPH